MKEHMLIKNAHIITGSDVDYEDGCLLVKGGVIEYVGHKGGLPECGNAYIVDAKGGVVMPGFVNAHTHLPMTLMRSIADDMQLSSWLNDCIWPMEEKMNAEDAYWGSMLAIAEMVRGGVTAVNDQYFFMPAVAAAVRDGGIRGILARGLSDFALGGKEKLQEAADFHSEWDGAANGRIKVAMGPHAEYTCSAGFLEMIAEKANELNCLLHMHISETASEHAECIERHGMTPTAFLKAAGGLNSRALLAHCVHVSDEDMDIIAEAGASVLHCPDSNMKLGSGIARVYEMLSKGINVCIGTDGAASNNDLDLWNEMQKAAFLQKAVRRDAAVVPVEQAINMATLNGSAALRLRSGALKKGNAADFIVIDTLKPHYYPRADIKGHIVYCGKSPDVSMTVVAGKVLYENGEYKNMDIEEVLVKAEQSALRIRGRL